MDKLGVKNGSKNGINFWGKFLGEIFGGNFWGKFLGEIFWIRKKSKFLVKFDFC